MSAMGVMVDQGGLWNLKILLFLNICSVHYNCIINWISENETKGSLQNAPLYEKTGSL